MSTFNETREKPGNATGLSATDLSINPLNNLNSEMDSVNMSRKTIRVTTYSKKLNREQQKEQEKGEEGTIGPSSFDVINILGKGAFGKVYLVEKKSDKKKYAMKVLHKKRMAKDGLIGSAVTERNVFSIMEHPFIVGLNSAFQTPEYLFLIIDYCPGGDFAKLLHTNVKLSEDIAKLYLIEILLGLEELHGKGIVYRDLKPGNVVIDCEGHAMLTDFGISKEGMSQSSQAYSFCGSIAYLAPEVIMRQGHGKSVDWYLLGVIMYEMLVGMTPFYSKNKMQLFENIKKGKLEFPSWVSKNAKDLLTKVILTHNFSFSIKIQTKGLEQVKLTQRKSRNTNSSKVQTGNRLWQGKF